MKSFVFIWMKDSRPQSLLKSKVNKMKKENRKYNKKNTKKKTLPDVSVLLSFFFQLKRFLLFYIGVKNYN